MRILLFDHASDGHHKVYDKSILQGLLHENPELELRFLTCPNPNLVETDDSEHSSITHYIPNSVQKLLNLFPTRIRSLLLTLVVLIYARIYGFKKIHFLYVDCCLLALFLFFPLTFGMNILGTLHRFPAHQSKSYILKLLLRTNILQQLVVHGEYTKNRIVEKQLSIADQIETVILPNLQDQEPVIEAKLPEDLTNSAISEQLKSVKRPLLLAFGGLRHEKGIDILLASLARMEQEATLVIAGPESSFTKAELIELMAKLNIGHKVFLDIRYIPNEQVNFYFNLCDIVVLPYRKSFLGQSGPLTEGIARTKLVIGPNHGEIGFTLQHFGLGMVYESENIPALAKQLDQAVRLFDSHSGNIRNNQIKYNKLVHIDAFKQRYRQIILSSPYNENAVTSNFIKPRHWEFFYYLMYMEIITNLWYFTLL